MLQSCGACGKVRHYPRPLCDACYSFDVRWIEAKGTGTVHSWTVTHHAFNPGFKAELPYVLVTVDLAEGVRMQAPLRGADAGIAQARSAGASADRAGAGGSWRCRHSLLQAKGLRNG